jgi:hypothetical protein
LLSAGRRIAAALRAAHPAPRPRPEPAEFRRTTRAEAVFHIAVRLLVVAAGAKIVASLVL